MNYSTPDISFEKSFAQNEPLIDIAEMFLSDERQNGNTISDSVIFKDLFAMVRRHLSMQTLPAIKFGQALTPKNPLRKYKEWRVERTDGSW